MIFRLEEVVLASSAALVDDRFFGQHLREAPIFAFQMDPVSAVGTGVRQCDAVITVLAVDQQQEVDGSRYAELLFAVQCHGMERKA